MKYIVENTRTESKSEHRTWDAAFKAAAKHSDFAESVVIHERDRDGERTYNTDGKILGRDGHWE